MSKDITPTDESKKANPERDSYDFNKMDKEEVDRYGPGNLEDFVDFEEYDGGDGQMGVAGDGKAGLEKVRKEGVEELQCNQLLAGEK